MKASEILSNKKQIKYFLLLETARRMNLCKVWAASSAAGISVNLNIRSKHDQFGGLKVGADTNAFISDTVVFKAKWMQTKKADYGQHTLLHPPPPPPLSS